MRLKQIIIIAFLFLFVSTNVKGQDSTFYSSKKDTTTFVQIIQDPRIDIVNNYFKEVNSADTLIDGYRIQIYFGSREKAYRKRDEFKELFEGIYSKIIYEEPNFKTVVGKYHTKLDADRELRNIQVEFSDAFIIRNKIIRE